MTVRILRRPKEILDAETIADYLAQDSLLAAIRFLENAESTIQALAESPGGGTRLDSGLLQLANLRLRRLHGFPNHMVFFIERSGPREGSFR